MMRMDRYIGRSVELIYMDRMHRCSKRIVTVHRVKGSLVLAYDQEKRGYRTFRMDQILALFPLSA